MPEIARINMEKARFNPEGEFGSPHKLASCIAMTRGQKIATLQRWEMQIRDRFKTAHAGIDPDRAARDFLLLEEIRDAHDGLRASWSSSKVCR